MKAIQKAALCALVILTCTAVSRPAMANGFEIYAGIHSSYAYETPPGAEQGVSVGNGSAFNLMAEMGLNFYRWGVFVSAGYKQSFLELQDAPEVQGTAYSADLGFRNLFEANVGAKLLLLPYRSWFQLYVSGGLTFAPQNVELLVYNRLVETSFAPRFGAFAQIEATVNMHRRYYIGLFAGMRYMFGSWRFEQPYRFPTTNHQIAFLAGVRGGFMLGQI